MVLKCIYRQSAPGEPATRSSDWEYVSKPKTKIPALLKITDHKLNYIVLEGQ